MKISQRVQAVVPSATLAVTAKAKALKREGVDILALSAGEPDFDTPEPIKRAAIAAMERGETKYTPVPGQPALRTAVAERTAGAYGRAVGPEQVIIGTGGKHVLFNACAALLDPGDEAVFGAPYWVSYPDMIRFAGAEPVIVNADERSGFLPQADDIREALTDRSRLLILNSPANPTGAAYSRTQLEAIADVVRGHPNLFVITDDIYEALVYDGDFVSFAHVATDLADRTLIASGVSKTYAMTGWRIGYGIGPEELVAAMGRLQGASTSGACSIAQAAAIEAVTGDQGIVSEFREKFRARRDRIVSGLRGIDGVSVFEPVGTFYCFPRVDGFYGDRVGSSQALCEHLLDSVGLAVVPGSAFGSDAHIRLSFACSEADIDDGLDRLARGLTALGA